MCVLILFTNMISFKDIMKKVLTERMSFKDLLRYSDSDRIDRSRDVNTKSLKVTSMDGRETWIFSYKSSPSTTGQRWQGYIKFFKEDVSEKDRAEDLDCMVDCSCPDFRYRWAYADTKQDASVIGNDSLNKCINSPPRQTNPEQSPGMCKHLIALGEYLKTNVDSDAPDPEDEKDINPPVAINKHSSRNDPTQAPDPDDSYTDSREDGYSDSRSLQEATSPLYNNINKFVNNVKSFDVEYAD